MYDESNGGPAFPMVPMQGYEQFGGMTLRDYFAAAALTGCVASMLAPSESHAEIAYKIADAMIEKRKKDHA